MVFRCHQPAPLYIKTDARAGDAFAYFEPSDVAGWAVGDTVVFASSGLTSSEAEPRVITSIKKNATHAVGRCRLTSRLTPR